MSSMVRTAIQQALTRVFDARAINQRLRQLYTGEDQAGTPEEIADVLRQSISVEMAEKSPGTRYPMLLVYCERVINTLR